MALIKSTMFSVVSGSINGTTFSRNRYGAYARNRTVPVNPNTEQQQLARASLANSSLAWKALTEEQRTAWDNYAAATPVINRIGDTITLSGIAMYNKLNTFQLFNGLAQVAAAPLTPGLATPLIVDSWEVLDSLSAEPNTILIGGYSNGDTTANSVYSAFISHPVTAGKTFYNGPWTYCGKKTGTTRNTAYTIPFEVTVGQIFFVRVRYRDAANKLATDLILGPQGATSNP